MVRHRVTMLSSIFTLFSSFPFHLHNYRCTKNSCYWKNILTRKFSSYQTTLHSWNSEIMIDQSKNCSKNLDIRPLGNFQIVQISSGLAPNFLEYLPNTHVSCLYCLYCNFLQTFPQPKCLLLWLMHEHE